jgi:hypothetical protein
VGQVKRGLTQLQLWLDRAVTASRPRLAALRLSMRAEAVEVRFSLVTLMLREVLVEVEQEGRLMSPSR